MASPEDASAPKVSMIRNEGGTKQALVVACQCPDHGQQAVVTRVDPVHC